MNDMDQRTTAEKSADALRKIILDSQEALSELEKRIEADTKVRDELRELLTGFGAVSRPLDIEGEATNAEAPRVSENLIPDVSEAVEEIVRKRRGRKPKALSTDVDSESKTEELSETIPVVLELPVEKEDLENDPWAATSKVVLPSVQSWDMEKESTKVLTETPEPPAEVDFFEDEDEETPQEFGEPDFEFEGNSEEIDVFKTTDIDAIKF